MEFTIVSADVGNANIKMKSAHGKTDFPHALTELTGSQVERLQTAGDIPASTFLVNGKYYAIGEQAVRSGAGAARYGAARYVPDYYGVLIAIGLFRTLPEDTRNIYLLGTHTVQDKVYKKDMIDAAQRTWTVENQGIKHTFRILNMITANESDMHYRFATMADGGLTYRGNERIRRGSCAILDIGGLTTALSVADAGKIDHTAGDTRMRGVLDALDELGRLLRSKFSRELKQTRSLNPLRLRDALMDGEFDAGGLGILQCAVEAEESSNIVVSDLLKFFDDWGGSASYDSVLLAGGGGALLRARIKRGINHRHVFLTDDNIDQMFMGAAIGGFRTLQLLEAKGKL